MLQYARPRVPELRPAQLLTCVERVRELTAERVTDAGLAVELDAAPRARGATLYMDPDLVTQVLLNVTLNAVEATPPGGALRYELRRVRRRRPPRGPGRRAGDAASTNGASPDRAAAGWIEYQQVRVVDTGPGIPRHLLPKLFDPFFSTKPRGTGLGLAICQTIMQEHGGTIEIASREGRGTAVLLSFPVEKRHGERRESDRHAERQATPRR
jgi:signal transduction histidine kinase